MTGSVKKRKRRGERRDGRILVTLVVGVTEDGKPKRKFFYGHTRQEAERRRSYYMRMQEYGLSADADKITVGEWIDEYVRRYKIASNPDYEANNKSYIERLKLAVGSRLIRSVVEADLVDALGAVSEMSTSTINKYYAFIRQVFSSARRNRIILADPSECLVVPSGTSGSHRALERWEVDVILNHWQEHRAGLWAMLMLLCGLRRGEMIALDWSNVDMTNRELRVCEAAVIRTNQSEIRDRTKTSAGMRTLPICDALFAALDSVPEAERVGLVCRSSSGKQLSQSAFSRGWDGFNLAMQRILNNEPVIQQGRRERLEDRIREAEANGRKYILFNVRAHDLRHTFATALYDSGLMAKSIKAAQYYMGHSSVKMTLDLYTHLSQERERSDRSQLVGFLNDWISRPVAGDPGFAPGPDADSN